MSVDLGAFPDTPPRGWCFGSGMVIWAQLVFTRSLTSVQTQRLNLPTCGQSAICWRFQLDWCGKWRHTHAKPCAKRIRMSTETKRLFENLSRRDAAPPSDVPMADIDVMVVRGREGEASAMGGVLSARGVDRDAIVGARPPLGGHVLQRTSADDGWLKTTC